VGEQIGSSWVVQEGVKPGQRVIIEGIQKVSPGMRVSPKMAHAMAKVAE
jgi:membrane fusion protein (multidrug efflux system)